MNQRSGKGGALTLSGKLHSYNPRCETKDTTCEIINGAMNEICEIMDHGYNGDINLDEYVDGNLSVG